MTSTKLWSVRTLTCFWIKTSCFWVFFTGYWILQIKLFIVCRTIGPLLWFRLDGLAWTLANWTVLVLGSCMKSQRKITKPDWQSSRQAWQHFCLPTRLHYRRRRKQAKEGESLFITCNQWTMYWTWFSELKPSWRSLRQPTYGALGPAPELSQCFRQGHLEETHASMWRTFSRCTCQTGFVTQDLPAVRLQCWPLHHGRMNESSLRCCP